MIVVNEIFHSIQGESTRAGLPTVFIRTTGCHLRCSYCDTKYAYTDGEKLNIREIIERVENYNTPFVCVTGGEPLLQKDVPLLLKELCDLKYIVSLETSGDLSCRDVDSRVKKIIDVKTPGSNACKGLHSDNFPQNKKVINVKDEYKFVICSDADFDWAENFCHKHYLFDSNCVLYSPSHEKLAAQWLAKKILNKNSQARLQLQLHKYIWSSSERNI